jgi:Rrf2 family protein
MISQAAEYSLRAILCLARLEGKAITIHDLSEKAKVPREYFAKVLQTLVRARVVTSQRGLGGGFALHQPADQLTIWDVVRAVDPSRRIDQCPARLGSHERALCPLHRRLNAAVASMEQVLRSTTIADLLREADDETTPCLPNAHKDACHE